MIVKFLQDYRQGLRLYKEGDKAEIDKSVGSRLAKEGVVSPINKPDENMAINSDYLENRR